MTLLTTILIGNKKNVQDPDALHGKGKATKGSYSATVKAANTATSAGSRGQKRKGDLTQQDDVDHDEHPPAKKGKALPTAEQRTRPVPRPVQKNTQRLEVAQGEDVMVPVNCHNTKKRPNEAAATADGNNPKTPVPSKKAKVGGPNQTLPIRRTGKPFFFPAQMKLIYKNRDNNRVSWINGGCSKTYRH
jgi:hypothetical protein